GMRALAQGLGGGTLLTGGALCLLALVAREVRCVCHYFFFSFASFFLVRTSVRYWCRLLAILRDAFSISFAKSAPCLSAERFQRAWLSGPASRKAWNSNFAALLSCPEMISTSSVASVFSFFSKTMKPSCTSCVFNAARNVAFCGSSVVKGAR